MNLDSREFIIHNDGERLIPGITHTRDELIRHRSSYLFFRRIIERDLAILGVSYDVPLRILDLGCGVGHGTRFLADIPGVELVGVDVSKESIDYAREKYNAPNIFFIVSNIVAYVPVMPLFDYVVSRHVLEHIEDGLSIGLSTRWARRLLINVPFNEKPANVHHCIHLITREHFFEQQQAEIFYEDLQGVTYKGEVIPDDVNSIVYTQRSFELLPVETLFSFPLRSWQPSVLDDLALSHLEEKVSKVGLLGEYVKSFYRRLGNLVSKCVKCIK